MADLLEGLQFPIDAKTQKPSTSKTGKAIIAAALAHVDDRTAQLAAKEKDWRKNYPYYFRALVEHGILKTTQAITIAAQGLQQAQQSFTFNRDNKQYSLQNLAALPHVQTLYSTTIQGKNQKAPEWYVPYHGKKLQGQDLLDQILKWEQDGIIEPSHAQALREAHAHPEWFDLSDRTMVLFGAASEAGPLTWLSQWKANIVAIDLPNTQVWEKIIQIIEQGNATLIAPSSQPAITTEQSGTLAEQLGVDLLTQLPEIIQWLNSFQVPLDLAAIAYLDGEKHVRVAMAMDTIMQQVSQHKRDSSLMFMCTPTDIYAVPKEVILATHEKSIHRSQLQKLLTKGISILSLKHLFKSNIQHLIRADNQKQYGIADGLVVEQGPNYALAKRLQQWRAVLARHQGQLISINVAPSTTTRSVTKNPLLKAAFDGADLFDVEAFQPETTNALMAALWIHDLRNPKAISQPSVQLEHPLALIMQGANHGGLWRVPYLVRSALPFAALYGFAKEKIPLLK